jgi:hypothetical protein
MMKMAAPRQLQPPVQGMIQLEHLVQEETGEQQRWQHDLKPFAISGFH